jgi:hypothetical protein
MDNVQHSTPVRKKAISGHQTGTFPIFCGKNHLDTQHVSPYSPAREKAMSYQKMAYFDHRGDIFAFLRCCHGLWPLSDHQGY